jgi:thiopeptide-type bacteriocin biosynthesis protein
VRLRFHGARERLVGHLFAHVCEWAERLMAEGIRSKFMLDAYEQEIERFGGPAAMEAAEAVFFADSRAAVQLLRARRSKLWPHDDVALAALSVDDLLAGLGLAASDRLAWYRAQVKTEPAEVGAEYRRRKTVLRALLAGSPEEQTTSRDVQAALHMRHDALASIADRLQALGVKEELTQSLDTICASYVHLHLNRLGLDPSLEQRILGLLARTRASLAKAPL